MCWVTNREPECKVAKEDIITLKVVEKRSEYDFFWPYYKRDSGFIYRLNEVAPKVQIGVKLNNIDLGGEVNGLRYEIHQGYHSYVQGVTWGKPRIRAGKSVIDVNGTPYYVGYFSFLCVVECTIPKGVKYYVNEYKEYVSEQIVINKILKEFNHVF